MKTHRYEIFKIHSITEKNEPKLAHANGRALGLDQVNL
jgi:hypothetical protein